MSPVIGIIGLGTMGLGLVQVYAQAGFQVLATDGFPAARGTALARLRDVLAPRIAAGKMTEAACDALLSTVTIVPDLASLARADLVIEAIAEDLPAKQTLIRDLEAHVARDAVLATNTSSLSVGQIAAAAANPGRVLGLHFFNPAPAMKLVELVGHEGSFIHSLNFARDLTEKAGKTVIACPDRPGFIVNRCARPYYGEALALVEEGRTPAEIDAAMQAAGYRLGPFALIDLIGADINLAATLGLNRAMGGHPRYHVFDALSAQVAKGHLGRKSGRGFIMDSVAPPTDGPDIQRRIEATLINEAGWLLAEGGTTQDGIDTAMRLGLNFPHGPFTALKRFGPGTIRQTLQDLEKAAPPHLKTRYNPAPILA